MTRPLQHAISACMFAAVLMSAALLSPRAQAQTFTVLHNFAEAPDGASPQAGLIRDAKGDLYGTTGQGGLLDCPPGCGTIFELDSTGKETVLYRFNGTDGNNPAASLIRDSAGNLYGTTLLGGTSFLGNVFKLDPSDNVSVLYSFTGQPDGASPYAALIRDSAGNLYGTTIAGGGGSCVGVAGAPDGCGTVFKLDASGHETLLHSFTGSPDGAEPYAGLIADQAGNLYGATSFGGSGPCAASGEPVGCGTVFKIDTSGTLTVLYNFQKPPDGNYPDGTLVMDKVGNLYGTTYQGGAHEQGVVFRIDPSGKETRLHSFKPYPSHDGERPSAGLTLGPGGILYGTTLFGGTTGEGTIFSVTRAGEESVLYSINAKSEQLPYAGVVADSAGNLYGTTYFGGDAKCFCGVVFKLTP